MQHEQFKPGNYVRYLTGYDPAVHTKVARVLEDEAGGNYKLKVFETKERIMEGAYYGDIKPIPIIDCEPWLLNWDLFDKGPGEKNSLYRVKYTNEHKVELKAVIIVHHDQHKVELDLGFMKKEIKTLHELQNFLKEYHEFDLKYAADTSFPN